MSFFPGKDPAAGNTYQCDAISRSSCRARSTSEIRRPPRTAVGPHAHGRPIHLFRSFRTGGIPCRQRADVRPHPHIGLATVTYLFDGEIMHRDSLGTAMAIRPGEVNWIRRTRHRTFGAYASRTTRRRRTHPRPPDGSGLPAAKEEMEAGFAHHAAAEFPVIKENGKNVRVVVGSL